jgi:HAD superfamily hydrolase (TIGR01509 family)
MRYSYSQLNGITKPEDAEGVIFDIDGTLANSWKLGFDATQVVLKNRNIPLITEELYHECTKYSTPDRLARHAGYIPGENGFDEIGKVLAAEFDELYVGLVDKSTAGFYPGIDELILDLPVKRGVKVAALTNACVAYAHAVLKTNCDGRDLYSRFISIHGADTVPQPKPKPDGLLLCCQEIDISPERCVYVGDSPTDGSAAKAAGMIAIGCSWGSHSESSLRRNGSFDFICSSVSDLKDLLPK